MVSFEEDNTQSSFKEDPTQSSFKEDSTQSSFEEDNNQSSFKDDNIRSYFEEDNTQSSFKEHSNHSSFEEDNNQSSFEEDNTTTTTSQDSTTTDSFLDFGNDSEMPPMLNLQKAGLRRSPRIAAQQSRPWYKCNLISRCFCVLLVATTLSWSPSVDTIHSRGQNLIFAEVNSFHSVNQNVDNTLNVLHPMALGAEK